MATLQGIQLRRLDLSCCQKVTDASLEALRGNTTLTSLVLKLCGHITPEGLDCLRGMPLALLNLDTCIFLGTNGCALEKLRGLPLTSLSFLGFCLDRGVDITNICKEILRVQVTQR